MDYAQSRLQARFGDRPDESLWLELEAAPNPAAALDIARSSGLRRWVVEIPPRAASHEIELALRQRWRECVSEVASWAPERWQPALLWTRGLVDLPALCHLARGEAPLHWMSDDAVLQIYARADAAARAARLRDDCREIVVAALGTADHPGSPALPGPSQICQAWLEEWRQRWPRWGDMASLENLAGLFQAAMKQPARIGRPELNRKLRSLFRCSVLNPVAAFIYIAFAALDIERLRAGLLQHALADEGITSS